ncbi:SCP2 sterol-binding domain-containing protein [Bacillus sp. EB01]|uniref:SCP2 sterol-binding domain-containing protein n=1 Tax=Bacillus sp. EB01 TaxID=1347086 RepID=UPI0005C581CB|nr:SCP2 sterol-binding domain-containing protein [Bacillus sp. EB01]
MNLFETMREIENEVNQNPNPILGINTVYQFDISGDEEGTYQLHFKEGQAKVVKGSESPADCTLSMSFDSFRKFLAGKLNGTMAFMTGKLKIKGDMTKAIKLETILQQYKLDV